MPNLRRISSLFLARLARCTPVAAIEDLCEALARHCREAGFEVAAWEVGNEPDIGEDGGTPHFFTKGSDYAPVNTLKVLHFGRMQDLEGQTLRLEPWGIRWIEVE